MPREAEELIAAKDSFCAENDTTGLRLPRALVAEV